MEHYTNAPSGRRELHSKFYEHVPHDLWHFKPPGATNKSVPYSVPHGGVLPKRMARDHRVPDCQLSQMLRRKTWINELFLKYFLKKVSHRNRRVCKGNCLQKLKLKLINNDCFQMIKKVKKILGWMCVSSAKIYVMTGWFVPTVEELCAWF